MIVFSWNINGFLSCNKYGGLTQILENKPDFICLQETKISNSIQFETLFAVEYKKYFNFSNNKGHNGVCIYAKQPAVEVERLIGDERFDCEGRFLCLEYPKYSLINIYMPHGGRDKKDIAYKLDVYDTLCRYIEKKKKAEKTIIIVGDFNVANTKYDLERYKNNEHNTMYTAEERRAFSALLSLGMKDVYREQNPLTRQYTWWPYAYNARENNIGWRIDYCLVYNCGIKINNIKVHKEIYGSDHCPIEVNFNL